MKLKLKFYRINLEEDDANTVLTPPTPPPRRFAARTSIKKRLPCIRKQESADQFSIEPETRLLVERQPDGPSQAMLSQQRRSHVELSTRHKEGGPTSKSDRRNSLQLQAPDSKSTLVRLLSADLSTQPQLLVSSDASSSDVLKSPARSEKSVDRRSIKEESVGVEAKIDSRRTSPGTPNLSREHSPCKDAFGSIASPAGQMSPEHLEPSDQESSDEYGDYDFDQNFKAAEENELRDQQHALLTRLQTNTLTAESAEKAAGKSKKKHRRSFRLSRKSKKRNKSPTSKLDEKGNNLQVESNFGTLSVCSAGSQGLLSTSSRASSANPSQRNSHLDLSQSSSALASAAGDHLGNTLAVNPIPITKQTMSVTLQGSGLIQSKTQSKSTSPTDDTAKVKGTSDAGSSSASSSAVKKGSFSRPRALSNIVASLRFVPVPAMAVAGFNVPGENLLETRFYSAGQSSNAPSTVNASSSRAGVSSMGRRSIGHGLTAAMAAATGALAVGGAAHRASPFRASYHGKSAKQSALNFNSSVDRRLLNPENVRTAGNPAANPLEVVGSAESLVSRVLQEQGLGESLFNFFR